MTTDAPENAPEPAGDELTGEGGTPEEDQRIQEYRGNYYMEHQVMLTHTGVIRHLVAIGLEKNTSA
jgi:hypothetical protein